MKSDSTANQRLAELLLGRPLSEYVIEKRTSVPRWTWRLIAEQLATDTEGDVQVSHETLRQWYGATDDEAAAVAS